MTARLPDDRLLLVGTSTRDTQVFLGDKDISNVTQRVELDIDARTGSAHAVITLLPRDGYEIALSAQTAIAFLPRRGLCWRRYPLSDGSVLFRCEQEAIAGPD
jgi:hypothetical protein